MSSDHMAERIERLGDGEVAGLCGSGHRGDIEVAAT